MGQASEYKLFSEITAYVRRNEAKPYRGRTCSFKTFIAGYNKVLKTPRPPEPPNSFFQVSRPSDVGQFLPSAISEYRESADLLMEINLFWF